MRLAVIQGKGMFNKGLTEGFQQGHLAVDADAGAKKEPLKERLSGV